MSLISPEILKKNNCTQLYVSFPGLYDFYTTLAMIAYSNDRWVYVDRSMHAVSQFAYHVKTLMCLHRIRNGSNAVRSNELTGNCCRSSQSVLDRTIVRLSLVKELYHRNITTIDCSARYCCC